VGGWVDGCEMEDGKCAAWGDDVTQQVMKGWKAGKPGAGKWKLKAGEERQQPDALKAA
jgi:hypothetical protein